MLLLPELLDDFLDEHRIDARGHVAELRALLGSEGLEAALQGRTGLEGLRVASALGPATGVVRVTVSANRPT
jgi:hypothetical protein